MDDAVLRVFSQNKNSMITMRAINHIIITTAIMALMVLSLSNQQCQRKSSIS